MASIPFAAACVPPTRGGTATTTTKVVEPTGSHSTTSTNNPQSIFDDNISRGKRESSPLSSSKSDWVGLLVDLLDLIWSMLSSSDQLVRVTLVCRSWYRANTTGNGWGHAAGWNYCNVSEFMANRRPSTWLPLLGKRLYQLHSLTASKLDMVTMTQLPLLKQLRHLHYDQLQLVTTDGNSNQHHRGNERKAPGDGTLDAKLRVIASIPKLESLHIIDKGCGPAQPSTEWRFPSSGLPLTLTSLILDINDSIHIDRSFWSIRSLTLGSKTTISGKSFITVTSSTTSTSPTSMTKYRLMECIGSLTTLQMYNSVQLLNDENSSMILSSIPLCHHLVYPFIDSNGIKCMVAANMKALSSLRIDQIHTATLKLLFSNISAFPSLTQLHLHKVSISQLAPNIILPSEYTFFDRASMTSSTLTRITQSIRNTSPKTKTKPMSQQRPTAPQRSSASAAASVSMKAATMKEHKNWHNMRHSAGDGYNVVIMDAIFTYIGGYEKLLCIERICRTWSHASRHTCGWRSLNTNHERALVHHTYPLVWLRLLGNGRIQRLRHLVLQPSDWSTSLLFISHALPRLSRLELQWSGYSNGDDVSPLRHCPHLIEVKLTMKVHSNEWIWADIPASLRHITLTHRQANEDRARFAPKLSFPRSWSQLLSIHIHGFWQPSLYQIRFPMALISLSIENMVQQSNAFYSIERSILPELKDCFSKSLSFFPSLTDVQLPDINDTHIINMLASVYQLRRLDLGVVLTPLESLRSLAQLTSLGIGISRDHGGGQVDGIVALMKVVPSIAELHIRSKPSWVNIQQLLRPYLPSTTITTTTPTLALMDTYHQLRVLHLDGVDLDFDHVRWTSAWRRSIHVHEFPVLMNYLSHCIAQQTISTPASSSSLFV
jgi:hypothetical protein